MPNLKLVEIKGESEDIRQISEIMKDLQIIDADLLEKNISLTVSKVLPSACLLNSSKKGESFFYVAVPSNGIKEVLMEEADEVRFGTITDGERILTKVVAIYKGEIALYVCLTPADMYRIKQGSSLIV